MTLAAGPRGLTDEPAPAGRVRAILTGFPRDFGRFEWIGSRA